tara:strand:- start:50 stop:739 length:690 start_codon:yes stop_codon:yes gene_type:complete
MRIVVFLVISVCISKSQDYKLTCFGIHIADIKQKFYEVGKVEYKAQSRGVADLIWPTNNEYYTSFNTKTFSLKSWGKKIEQGLYKSSLNAKIDSTNKVLKYDEKSVPTGDSTHTIFTMLAMVQVLPFKALDTKWFSYEHQGKIGKTRFLWSDSSKVWSGEDSILCDHYRMDINIIDSTFTIKEKKDYFMENILDENYVKEIWVTRGKERKIVKASVKNNWITLIAKTNQ